MKSSQPLNARGITVAAVILLAVSSIASIYLTYRYLLYATVRDVTAFLDVANSVERGYIEHIPLYEDFATPQVEMKLRTRLFPAHMAAALGSGSRPVDRDEEIPQRIDEGSLVRLSAGKDAPYFFYNVREPYRALTPDAARGLETLARRLQSAIAARAALPRVKIAVSSALRPASYQTGLRGTNYNAVPVTTHSYGVSFDIFYDDYFVVLTAPVSSNPISRVINEKLRNRIGFMLGDSLRGQFRSVLTETLVQLQDEGVLYAILETRQRCYHVTVLSPARPVTGPE